MYIKKLFPVFLFLTLVLSACATAVSPVDTPEPATPEEDVITDTPEMEPVIPDSDTPDSQPPPRGAEREFSTDFSVHSIPYDEILSGGPPKDGIPSIDDPVFVSIDEADEWLRPVEPVIQMLVGDDARAYPIQILTWHEIVNDTVGGVPVVVTFCPLCNTGIAFERTVDDLVLDFGTTGRLRFSNLIMYDRQTETWWQQATGEGIVGEFTGHQLEFVPAAMVSWEEFKQANPDGIVLSRDTGFNRSYGRNPYIGYDDVNNPPFLFQGPETPDELPPVARVLALEFDGEAAAYPYVLLSEEFVVNDRVGDQEVVVFWAPGQASALDTQIIAEGQDVGSAVAYSRLLDDQLLTFDHDGGVIIDQETGSTWNILGRAVDGPLAGEQLTEVVSVNHFWFSWAAFRPETRIYQPSN